MVGSYFSHLHLGVGKILFSLFFSVEENTWFCLILHDFAWFCYFFGEKKNPKSKKTKFKKKKQFFFFFFLFIIGVNFLKGPKKCLSDMVSSKCTCFWKTIKKKLKKHQKSSKNQMFEEFSKAKLVTPTCSSKNYDPRKK